MGHWAFTQVPITGNENASGFWIGECDSGVLKTSNLSFSFNSWQIYRVILSKEAVQIFFIATSTYQSEGFSHQGNRHYSDGDWAVYPAYCIPSYIKLLGYWYTFVCSETIKERRKRWKCNILYSAHIIFTPPSPVWRLLLTQSIKNSPKQKWVSHDKSKRHKATNRPNNAVALLHRSLKHTPAALNQFIQLTT